MSDFEVLVLDGTNPTGVAMTRDILDAARLFAARAGQAAPRAKHYEPSAPRTERGNRACRSKRTFYDEVWDG